MLVPPFSQAVYKALYGRKIVLNDRIVKYTGVLVKIPYDR